MSKTCSTIYEVSEFMSMLGIHKHSDVEKKGGVHKLYGAFLVYYPQESEYTLPMFTTNLGEVLGR